MNEKEIKQMILALLTEADEDLAKFYVEETSEDWEEAELKMDNLISIVDLWVNADKK